MALAQTSPLGAFTLGQPHEKTPCRTPEVDENNEGCAKRLADGTLRLPHKAPGNSMGEGGLQSPRRVRAFFSASAGEVPAPHSLAPKRTWVREARACPGRTQVAVLPVSPRPPGPALHFAVLAVPSAGFQSTGPGITSFGSRREAKHVVPGPHLPGFLVEDPALHLKTCSSGFSSR
jgi:hypothetical protein